MEEKRIIEAALFVAGRALGLDELQKLVSSDPRKLIEELRMEYEGRAMEIVEVDGKYMMQVRDEYIPHVRDLAPKEIDDAVLRTLSVIAFNQPITQAEVVRVRGNKAYDHIRELERRGFIKSRPYGHTKLLETTSLFDEYFKKSQLG